MASQWSLCTWDECAVDRPMAMLERRRVMGERAMVSHVRLMPGCDVPVHSHDNEQISVVVSGRVRFTLGPEATVRELGAGDVLMLPGGCPHGAYALEETLILDVFAPPSAMTGIDRPKQAGG